VLIISVTTFLTSSIGRANPIPWAPDRVATLIPHQVTFDVDQRAARVPGVDAGVGLDKVPVDLLVGEGHVPLQGTDDPLGDGPLIAEGVADGEDRLAEHQVGRGADRDRGERAARVDLEDGEVHFLVGLDHPGRQVGAVEEVDLEPLHLVDDMVVGDDEPPAIDDDTGPIPLTRASGSPRSRTAIGWWRPPSSRWRC